MVYNEKAKLAHYRWREKNKEKYLFFTNRSAKKYYERNSESEIAKALVRYYWKKEAAIFRGILFLDEENSSDKMKKIPRTSETEREKIPRTSENGKRENFSVNLDLKNK